VGERGAAATERLRETVTRVAVAGKIDAAGVTVAVERLKRGYVRERPWRATVTWCDPMHRDRFDASSMQDVSECGATPDAAVDAVLASVDRAVRDRVKQTERILVYTKEALALWSAMRDAMEERDG
jgi:hypothetical protein